MKKTYKEIREADELVASLYRNDPTLEKSKFGYAWKRFIETNYQSVRKELFDKILDIRISNALEDEKTKAILVDDNPNSRGYKFSKEGLRKCVEQERDVFNKFDEKEIEVKPFISSYKPEMDEYQKEMLKGLVI